MTGVGYNGKLLSRNRHDSMAGTPIVELKGHAGVAGHAVEGVAPKARAAAAHVAERAVIDVLACTHHCSIEDVCLHTQMQTRQRKSQSCNMTQTQVQSGG